MLNCRPSSCGMEFLLYLPVWICFNDMIVQCLLIQFSAEHKPHHLCVPSCVLIMLFQRHDWSWKNLSGRQPEERDPKKVRSRPERDRKAQLANRISVPGPPSCAKKNGPNSEGWWCKWCGLLSLAKKPMGLFSFFYILTLFIIFLGEK